MLPTPTVMIEQAPEVPAELRQAVLDGCAQGLGQDACIAKGDPSAEGATYQVELEWSGENQRVKIVVRKAEWRLERELQFPPQDEARERGAAVGLVAAGTVAAHFSFQQAPNEKEEAPVAPPAEASSERKAAAPGSPPPELNSPQRLRTDLGFFLGSSLRDGPVALGITGRISWRGWTPPVFPLLAISYSRSGGEVPATHMRSWLGLGVELKSASLPLALELSGACVGERLTVSAAQGDAVEQGSALRLGPLVEADAIWLASEHFHVVVGGQASFLWPHVDITAAGQPIDRQQVFAWGALSGVRLSL